MATENERHRSRQGYARRCVDLQGKPVCIFCICNVARVDSYFSLFARCPKIGRAVLLLQPLHPGKVRIGGVIEALREFDVSRSHRSPGLDGYVGNRTRQEHCLSIDAQTDFRIVVFDPTIKKHRALNETANVVVAFTIHLSFQLIPMLASATTPLLACGLSRRVQERTQCIAWPCR